MEMGLGRWASDEKLCSMTTITGAEHIQKTLDDGFGVILLSAHFTTLELSGRVLALNCPPFDAVYRRFRSDFTTEIMASGREVSARRVIEKNDIKSMVRSLREGTPVWYAPDQSYHLKQSALLPFFGVPAMTNTATVHSRNSAKQKHYRFFRVACPRVVTNWWYCRRSKISRAETPSRTQKNMSPCWSNIFSDARSSTSGYTANSRTVPTRFLMPMEISTR
jgi:KDO2-lipid IV(A) lauroyltransferase